jgi:MFS family permease
LRSRARLAFSSLSVRNYRLYFAGQTVSFSGNWMQQVAIAWLVLRLTNSPLLLGVTMALQTLPYLLLGVWGGLVADRMSKRRLLLWTQSAQVAPALALWALSHTGSARLWMICVIVLVRGLINVFDNPARQSFVSEMVGPERIVNAVSLNASIVQAGRLLGPAAAAILIATVGLPACFLANGLTFVFMVAMLLLMNPGQLVPAPVAPRGRGQLRATVAEVARTPRLLLPLALMAIVGLLAFNFTVVLPAVARFTFHGTATTYAVMVNCLAAGSLAGAIASATRTRVSSRAVAWAALAFGAALAAAAAVDEFAAMLVALTAVGAASVMFSASAQAALQLAAAPEMRGRVLSLYQVVYSGTTPLGALIVGGLASTVGARSGLLVGAIAALLAGAGGIWASRGEAAPPTERAERELPLRAELSPTTERA